MIVLILQPPDFIGGFSYKTVKGVLWKVNKNITGFWDFFLRKEREKIHFSQQDIAVRLGVTFQQVQKYENGKNRVPIFMLIQYARIFDITPDVFFNKQILQETKE